MKIKLTEKFSKEKAGKTIEVSDQTAKDLIKEGKATEVGAKGAKQGAKEGKVVEITKEEETTEVEENTSEAPVIE